MGLYPKNLKEYVSFLGVPRAYNSKVFIVDTEHGSDSNAGTSFDSPLLTLAAAEDLCTADRHDTVLFVARDTGDTLTATLTWDKDYTHLIGVGCELPGMGQRCRITGGSTTDVTEVITLSANGCMFKNVQISNWADADVDSGALTVSGSRNVLDHVFVAGMGHATPGARAGSYSMKVTGSENLVKDSTIGLDTVLRAAANSELVISGSRNRFEDTLLLSYSETAGKFLAKVDNSAADLRYTWFNHCLFHNYTANWANGIDNAIDMPAAGNTHYVILSPDCQLVGVNSGWADTVTHVYTAGAAPNAGAGVSTNPTT
jgi:hypothetical protein